MELVAGVKATYERAVPLRWRAVLGAWGGKRRCNSGSQCERQCEELLRLVRAHAEKRCRRRSSSSSAGEVAFDDAGDDADEQALFRACVVLLDAPDHFLTQRRTTALARETLMEALVRSQREGGRYDEDARRCCVWLLERLEQHVQVYHNGCPTHATNEAQEYALLVHMGRGMELAERNARARGSFSSSSSGGGRVIQL
jgi:hypothetical protein